VSRWKKDASFSEEKEAKRLLFLMLLGFACQSMATAFAPPGNTGGAKDFCLLKDSTFW
jgi:hypothetical protein